MSCHIFKEDEWPFDCPSDLAVVTTKFVMNGEHPIVEVLHWEDGGWQFMCNTTSNADRYGMVVCMGCLYQKYPWISRFNTLKRGYLTYLDEETELWSIEAIE